MEDTLLLEFTTDVNSRITSTWSVGTLWASSIASVTAVSYCRTSGSDTIFELEIEIDEEISTDDAQYIDYDWLDRNVKGDEFEFHMNSNVTEYSI